jgi:hypothetical protein
MIFGSPELWIGETAVQLRGNGSEWAEYHAVVENRGSKDASGCRASLRFKDIYDDLLEGSYRFSIEQPCQWVDGGDEGSLTIPAGETRAVEVCRVVETGNDDYPPVRFPAADDDPPVDRYLLREGDVQRFDQSDHVPLPVFVRTDWEAAEIHLTAENHRAVDRELEVAANDGSVPAIDDRTFEVVFEDDDSVPSFKMP